VRYQRNPEFIISGSPSLVLFQSLFEISPGAYINGQLKVLLDFFIAKFSMEVMEECDGRNTFVFIWDEFNLIPTGYRPGFNDSKVNTWPTCPHVSPGEFGVTHGRG
jgi:hypothetical protein